MHFDQLRRRDFITLVGGAASWPLAARAQQREQMRRIGVLMSAASETDQQAGVTLFLEVLHQLGWIDSHNVRIEIRWARGDPAEARKDAEELVALPADVIMVTGQLGLEVLLRVTHSVPIVFNSVIDPVGGGQIDSLATQLALLHLTMHWPRNGRSCSRRLPQPLREWRFFGIPPSQLESANSP